MAQIFVFVPVNRTKKKLSLLQEEVRKRAEKSQVTWNETSCVGWWTFRYLLLLLSTSFQTAMMVQQIFRMVFNKRNKRGWTSVEDEAARLKAIEREWYNTGLVRGRTELVRERKDNAGAQKEKKKKKRKITVAAGPNSQSHVFLSVFSFSVHRARVRT